MNQLTAIQSYGKSFSGAATVSGPNYSSGAPDFTPDATLSLMLLAQ